MFKRLFRRRQGPDRFLRKICDQAAYTERGMEALQAYLREPSEARARSVQPIAALFNGPRDVEHVVEMLKLREIYRHLSNAADRGDEAANIIGDIVVKQM